MTPAPVANALRPVAEALAAAQAGGPISALIDSLPAARAVLPDLPAPFERALDLIQTRLESCAMFGEESCSFSQADLFEALQTWIERAGPRLAARDSSQPTA